MDHKLETMDTLAAGPVRAAMGATQLAGPQDASRPPTDTRTPPTRAAAPLLWRIGRFTVIERFGQDGVGVAYGAYDELLDRKVTVKVLRAGGASEDPQAHDRLLREARAMARLTHPNVARVYEVGAVDGQIFMAMEFVRGQDLGEWLSAAPRTWRARAMALVLAGRGLAAGHAAGLAHRDFRPGNVQIGGEHGDDVKVIDFGLANAVDDAEDLARAGPGDPAYTAPERLAGAPASALGDQYSFCVALYEAVYGQLPFAYDSVRALHAAQLAGKIRDPPSGSAAPAALLPILRRGLAAAPADRYPAMPPLLAALELVLAPRRSWFLPLAFAGVAGLVVAAGIGSGRLGHDVCAGVAAGELTGVWDEPAIAAAEAGVRATKLVYAGETWDRVRPRLDDYGRALVDMRAESCRAHADGERSALLFDRQTACLDQRRASLSAFVAILQRADAEVIGSAAAAAADLPGMSVCGDLEALGAALPPPDDPEVARAVQDARETLAEAYSYELASQADRGLALLDSIAIAEIPHPPLLVEYTLRRGSLLSEAGRHDEADLALSDALRGALAVGHHVAAAAAATRREFIRAARLQRARDVLGEAPVVEGIVGRVAATAAGASFVGDRLNDLGIAHAVLGEASRAESYFEASVAARRATLGEHHPQVVYALGNLGLAAVERGALQEATGRLRAALTAAETSLGERHPHVALLAVNLGYAHHMIGQFRAAAVQLRRALELQTERLGPDAPDLQYAHVALGELAVSERRCDEARKHFREALRLLEQKGLDDPAALNPILGMGHAATCSRDFVTARAYLRRGEGLAERTHGADELRSADAHNRLGEMHLAAGELEEALVSYRKALAIRAAKLPADSPLQGEAHVRVGEALRRLGRLDEAAAAFAQARASCAGGTCESYLDADLHLRLGQLAQDRGDPAAAGREYGRAVAALTPIVDADHPDLAFARLGVSRALVAEAGVWTPAALALAQQAHAALQARGAPFAAEAGEAAAWLARAE